MATRKDKSGSPAEASTSSSRGEPAEPPHAPKSRSRHRSKVLLLDLAGDEQAAREWLSREFSFDDVSILRKADLKWRGKLSIVGALREENADAFAIFATDLNAQSRLRPLMLLAVSSGAALILAGDLTGRTLARSRLKVVLIDAPALAFELALGYGLVVPASWIITELLRVEIRESDAGFAAAGSRSEGGREVLYVRALPIPSAAAASASGGMSTHVSGFVEAAAALGHRIRMVSSGLSAVDGSIPCVELPAARLFRSTRALFELWSNLSFTWRSAKLLLSDREEDREAIDFIYQRYNRFNWTGVVLSKLMRLPLFLEVNGSEVWVSRNWDPVGQLWLLERFERLNLRAADAVFTVSEIERQRLIETGAAASRVFVNPNGADAERFRPDCGGALIRRRLGVDKKILVGFTGTFGPWHGTEILARAATLLRSGAAFHFLFVGDGDSRAETEAIVNAANNAVSATFAGRVPHSDVPAYLDACDILVAPHVPLRDGSEFFGSPTKLFEYLAMGKPVIASRLGQIADVIVDDENGLLVEPGDARSLALVIERVAGDAGLRERLGAAARRSAVERHTWRQNALRVFDTFARRTVTV